MKKKVILVITLVVIAILLIGGVIFFKSENALKVKETVFTFELGEKVPFEAKYYLSNNTSAKIVDASDIQLKNDYSLNQDNNELKTSGMDYLNVGIYDLIINYNGKSVSFAIKVEDTTEPEFIDFKDEIVLEQDSLNVDLIKFFEAKDLTDVTIVVDSNYDLSTPGEYTINVKATDQHNNTAIREAKVKVIKYEDIQDNELTSDLDGNIYKSQKRIDEEKKPKEEHNSAGNNNQTSKSESPATNLNTNNTTSDNKTSNNNVSVATYRRDIASQYVKRINDYREENGLPALQVTDEAQAEADMRAKQIADNYGHNSSYGFGENIGKNVAGYDFVEAWKNSWSHKNAMLREQNTAMAVSIYEKDGWWYAVTSFKMNY